MTYKRITSISKYIEKHSDGQPVLFIAQDRDNFTLIWDGNEELTGLIKDAIKADPLLMAVVRTATHEDFSEN